MSATQQPLSPTEYEVVARALNELPPRCRESLLLLRSGLTYAQIAARLDIDEARVRLLIFRALEYLLERVTSLSALPYKTLGAGPADTKTENKFSAACVGRNWGRS